MVCTDNKSLYEMLVMVRAHGWSRNVTPETKINLKNKFKINDFYEKYTFYHLGYNFRPMEIQGFLGCEQLKYINEICNKREKNFHRYQNASSNNHDFLKLDFKHMQFISNFDYPVICKNKNILRKYLKLFSNVEVRPIVGGSIVEQPFFKNQKKGLLEIFTKQQTCPNAKKIHELGFYIPNNPDLDENELQELCNLLQNKENL